MIRFITRKIMRVDLFEIPAAIEYIEYIKRFDTVILIYFL